MGNASREKENIYVLRVADLTEEPEDLSLDQKVDQLVENRCTVFIKNYAFLLEKEGITQAQFCDKYLENYPSPTQMAGFKKKGKDIPLRTMIRIATAFGKSLEEMTGTLLYDSSPEPVSPIENYSEYRKYCGTFDLAYFDTSAKLGSNKRLTPESLNYAVMTICPFANEVGVTKYSAIALFHCTEIERQVLYGFLEGVDLLHESSKVMKIYEKVAKAQDEHDTHAKYLYHGSLSLEGQFAEITMHQMFGSDFVHLLMHNRAASSSQGKKYSGGLAAIMSTSRGEEHMPCLQAGLISKPQYDTRSVGDPVGGDKTLLDAFPFLSKETIASKLFFAPPRIEIGSEVKDVLTYMKSLFPDDDAQSPFSSMSDQDKQYCVESYVSKKLSDVVRKNLLSYYKLSLSMDSEAYQLLKKG